MIDLSLAGVIVTVVLFIGTVAAAAVYVRSAIAKQTHEELEDLAQTRGEANADLRREIDELRQRVTALETERDVIRSLKAEEIADLTAGKLAPMITGANQ